MVDRDYSMMITHQPEWGMIRQKQIDKVIGSFKRKCTLIDIETGRKYIFASLRECDIEMGFSRGCTTMAIINQGIIQKKYRAEYYEA